MQESQFICPQPQAWDRAYRGLREAWGESNLSTPKPPVSLILNGWVFSSDIEKRERWRETVEWAKRHNLLHLIPEFSAEESYVG